MLRRSLALSLSCAPHRPASERSDWCVGWCWGLLALVLLGTLSAQFLAEPRAEAQSNQPPVITLQATRTVMEGEALDFNFSTVPGKEGIPAVTDPNGTDQITYTVEHVNAGGAVLAMPAGAGLVLDPLTAERRFRWWPDLNSAGTYRFRFGAIDEFGAAAVPQTITVTVTNRTGSPAMSVVRGWPMPNEGTALLPGERLRITESEYFVVAIDVADPENQAVTVTVSGVSKATLTRESPTRYVWRWLTNGWPPGSFPDAGVYQGVITATDPDGNRIEFPLTLDVGKLFFGDSVRYAMPNAGVSIGDLRASLANAVIRGIVPLNMSVKDHWGRGQLVNLPGLKIEYILVTASGIRTISPPLTYPDFSYQWDTTKTLDGTSVSDGTYILSLRILDGPDLNGLRPFTNQIVIDNVPGPVTGSQSVPLTTTAFNQFLSPQGPETVDWITYTSRPVKSAAQPFPYQVAPPPQNEAGRLALINPDNWFVESLVHTNNSPLYRGTPSFFQTHDGHVITAGGFNALVSSTAESSFAEVERHAHFDGPRGANGSVSPYSTFVANPEGPGWVGADLAGRVFRISPDGGVTTIAGLGMRDDVLPFQQWDASVSNAELIAQTKRVIGTFQDGLLFKMPVDLAFDPLNPKILYIADTGNNRITRTDFSGPTPVTSTFAGVPGPTGGFQDGPAATARFKSPYSLAIAPDGRTMYIADLENSAIRTIDMTARTVGTLVGGPNGPAVPDQATLRASMSERDQVTQNLSFAEAITAYPQVLRLDSRGNPIIGEHFTGTVRRVNLATGRMERIYSYGAAMAAWIWLDVDHKGLIGPVDDILIAPGSFQPPTPPFGIPNSQFHRIAADGSRINHIAPGRSGGPSDGREPLAYDPAGHYDWAITIDDTDARFVTTGFGSYGVYSFRQAKPSDPTGLADEYGPGEWIYDHGTVPGFPDGSRPPFEFVHGDRGDTRLGVAPDFDEITGTKTDAQLATYIQNGMGGSVSRPEVTGRDLAKLLYFIRRTSLQGSRQEISYSTIEQNLEAAGHYGPGGRSDNRLPEIRSVTVTPQSNSSVRISYQTDEPTLGIIEYGSTDRYGLFSRFETAFTKSAHAITLAPLLTNQRYFYRILAKDKAGNVTSYERSFGVGTPPNPPVISTVTATSITETSVAITWTTNRPSDSQVEYGRTTSYGSSTPLDSAAVTSHRQTLSALTPDTLYHYRVKSADQNGGAVSGDFTFRTLPVPVACNYDTGGMTRGGPVPTIRAVRSGNWTDPGTWNPARVPSATDDVLITGRDISVTMNLAYDANTTSDIASLTVTECARLVFPRTAATAVDLAGSLLVTKGGKMDMGTAADPLRENVRLGFNVESDRSFVGGGAVSPDPDRAHNHADTDIGLWAFDPDTEVTIAGAPTPNGIWLKLTEDALAGSRVVKVAAAPLQWEAGDTVLLTPTLSNPDEGELAVIMSVVGQAITLRDPLRFTHHGTRYAYDAVSRTARVLPAGASPGAGDILVAHQGEIAKLTQRVAIASNLVREGDPHHRAHTLVAHGAVMSMQNVSLRNLGPRSKLGRYAMHCHHCMEASRGVVIKDVSLWSSISEPGNRGFTDHNSEGMVFRGNVSFNTQGVGFYLEDAKEVENVLEGNLAVRTVAPEELPNAPLVQEFAYPSGLAAGFWVRECNTFRKNVAVGGKGADGFAITPLTRNVPRPSDCQTVFSGNESRATSVGLSMFGSRLVDVRQGLMAFNGKDFDVSANIGPTTIQQNVFWGNTLQRSSDASCVDPLTCTGNHYLPYPLPLSSPPPGDGGLLGYWKFDGDATDATTYGHDGVVTGSPTYIAGRKSQAVKLSAGDLITMGRPALFEIEGPVTLAAWVNVKDVTGGVARIAGKARGSTGGQGGYYLGHTGANPAFVWHTVQDWGQTTVMSKPQSTNTWIHVAGTFDGTTNKIYINGVLDASAPGTAPTDSPSYDFILGSLGMSLDDVCLFDEALTAEKIGKLATGTVGCDQLNALPPSEELCVAPRPENRIRLGAGDYSGLATTITITDPQGLLIYSGIHTATTKEGEIRITDPAILAKIGDTTLYTLTAHPESHRRRKITLLGSALKAAPCDVFPGSPFGFLDESGPITIQHLVRLIAHYRTQTDAQINRAFLSQRFTLRDLISVIKLYVMKVGQE